MAAIDNPKIDFRILTSRSFLEIAEHRVLMVGIKDPDAIAVDGQLYKDVQSNDTISGADYLFGYDSHLASMVRAFKEENKITRIDCICAAVETGTTYTNATISLTGAVVGDNQEYSFSVGSQTKYKFTVPVADAETGTDIGLAVEALDTSKAPFDFTGITNGFEITFKYYSGSIGTDWDFRVLENVKGIVTDIGDWVAGTPEPVYTDIFTAAENIRYQTVVYPSLWDTDLLKSFLDPRFNKPNQIMDGVGIQTVKGSVAELKAYAVQNSQSICILGNRSIDYDDRQGTMIPEINDIISSKFAAIRALRLTEGADISNYVTTIANKDQYGGKALSTLPYFNTFVPNVSPPLEDDTYTVDEQYELNDYGVSVIGSNSTYSNVLLGQMVTTYLTDTIGTPDSTYHFLNTVDTSSVIREYFAVNAKRQYAQARVTGGTLIKGRSIVTVGSLRAFLNNLYSNLADDAITQSGSEGLKDFNDNLTITLDLREGKFEFECSPLLVTGMRALIGKIIVNFGS